MGFQLPLVHVLSHIQVGGLLLFFRVGLFGLLLWLFLGLKLYGLLLLLNDFFDFYYPVLGLGRVLGRLYRLFCMFYDVCKFLSKGFYCLFVLKTLVEMLQGCDGVCKSDALACDAGILVSCAGHLLGEL